MFQSTPLSEENGDVPYESVGNREEVSIHAALRRERRLDLSLEGSALALFQSTPLSEENGDALVGGAGHHQLVSIHAALRRERRPDTMVRTTDPFRFQSTPLSEENGDLLGLNAKPPPAAVSIHAALRRERRLPHDNHPSFRSNLVRSREAL